MTGLSLTSNLLNSFLHSFLHAFLHFQKQVYLIIYFAHNHATMIMCKTHDYKLTINDIKQSVKVEIYGMASKQPSKYNTIFYQNGMTITSIYLPIICYFMKNVCFSKKKHYFCILNNINQGILRNKVDYAKERIYFFTQKLSCM